ncbi:MAG: magnesium transporter, partial [Nitrospinales bacterium]
TLSLLMVVPPLLLLFFSKKTILQQRVRRFFKTPHTPEITITPIILFIPFVIGLAGNVGIQGATIIVRGLATGDIQEDNIAHIVKNEILVGTLNGVIFGVLCGALISLTAEVLLSADPLLGLVVGTGIVLAVSVASLVGSLTPIIFINLDIDPAISTGPIITVANDILGLAIYLVTAKLILAAF